jgi:spectinomycin phosphotransferase
MLEKPNIQDEKIIACLRENYELTIREIEFLPLGADRDTAVFRADAADSTPYFLKLRSGGFPEPTVEVPKLLHDQGIAQIIPPLPTQSGALWATLEQFKVILYPFIEGQDGSEAGLSDQHWVDLGRALKGLHTANLPAELKDRIPREAFSPYFRERVRDFQAMAQNKTFADPISAQLAALLLEKQDVVSDLINRAETLAAALQNQPLELVVCHADIHTWNVLIANDGTLYVVDWDTLIVAPKERDLMFFGGGQYANQRSPEEEERLFYQGYGQTDANPIALAYYRYERIVQDISAYCEEVLLTEGDGEDRRNGLRLVSGQFLPGEVIEMTYRADKSSR